MLLEHVFISRLDAAETVQRTCDLLGAVGFRRTAGPRITKSGVMFLELFRGDPRAGLKEPQNWPEWLRLEWNRGRVSLAVRATAAAHQRTFRLANGVSGHNRWNEFPAATHPEHATQLITLAKTAQDVLGETFSLEEGKLRLIEADQQLRQSWD